MDSPGKNTGVGCHFLLQGMQQQQRNKLHELCEEIKGKWNMVNIGPPKLVPHLLC